MKSWWGKDTDQDISARSLTLFIFAVGVGIVWSTTTRTRVSDATAVTFCVKCFNLLKLYPLSGNIFRKRFASYFLFIHEHLINLIAVTAVLLTSGLHRCYPKIFKKNIICLRYQNQHFISYFVWNVHENWLLFLGIMQENKSGCFFPNTM